MGCIGITQESSSQGRPPEIGSLGRQPSLAPDRRNSQASDVESRSDLPGGIRTPRYRGDSRRKTAHALNRSVPPKPACRGGKRPCCRRSATNNWPSSTETAELPLPTARRSRRVPPPERRSERPRLAADAVRALMPSRGLAAALPLARRRATAAAGSVKPTRPRRVRLPERRGERPRPAASAVRAEAASRLLLRMLA